MVLSSVNSEPSQSGEWSENLDVKRANAVNELANVCNEYGAISVDSDGNPKDFTCSNSYYDKAESCWKNISEDDSVESDKCVGDIDEMVCSPKNFNMGSMLKSPECTKAFAKASILHGDKPNENSAYWGDDCTTDSSSNCLLFPNQDMKVGSSDGGRPDDQGQHPLFAQQVLPNITSQKRKDYCAQLSNSNNVLRRHNTFWTGKANSPAAYMAGNCLSSETSCPDGYNRIKSTMNNELYKSKITNSALLGMYQGLGCSSLNPRTALCQIDHSGKSTICTVPSDGFGLSENKYKEGCGKKCQLEIENLLAKLKIATQNVYFYLDLVMKYEGSGANNSFRDGSDNLRDISTIVSESGGTSGIIRDYFKALTNFADNGSDLDSYNSGTHDTDLSNFEATFTDPRSLKYLRLAGRNYLEISLIEKKIMTIYMFTHRKLKDRISSIKSEIKTIIKSNQVELDRLRENANTKVRGIVKRQNSLEGNRAGVVSLRICILVMVILFVVIGTVPEVSNIMKKMINIMKKK